MSGKLDRVRQFMVALPHAQALGMSLTELSGGEAEIAMPYADILIGDPVTGVVHGGAVSALMDTCCGAAVMSHPRNLSQTATIDLRIEYLRPAVPGKEIRARATCYHVTRSIAFVRATADDAAGEGPVAMATGTFTATGA